MSKKINSITPEEQEKIAMFKELLNDKIKQNIADMFDAGLEIGIFGKAVPIMPLFFQFIVKDFVFTMRREHIKTAQRPQTQQKPVNIQKLNKNIIGVK